MYFIKRKTLVSILIVAMVFSFLPASGSIQVVRAAEIHTDYLDSGSFEMQKLSKEEIIDLLADSPTDMSDEPEEIFDENPSVEAPYAHGKVKQELLQQTVDRLNALRRIAGLPDVVLDSSLCNQAQYGAVLLAVSEFSHYPSQPEDMDDAFYEQGRSATASSNIYGGETLTLTPEGFMDDSDGSNVDRLGHRRWQLNPSMGKIGFGYVLSPMSRYRKYTVEKAHDKSGGSVDYDCISWPASGYFPKELFNGNTAWSVTLNPSMYMTPKRNDLTVTLTRMSDEQSWTFKGADTYTQASSGSYFNVELSGYGVSNCIIFRPEGVSKYEGVYTVTIDGLKDKSGNPTDFSFQTDFFKAVPEELNRSMFTVDTDVEIYDGSAKSKKITTSLIENQDYSVTYTSNVDVGTASITITGTGMYYGELNYSFIIRPKELDRSMFTVDIDDEIYDGRAKSKTITSSLTEDEDYTVTYTSNVDVGTAYITITGKGMYYGELNYSFTIRPKELDRSMFSVDTSDEIYDGGAKSKTIISSLTENEDYTVTYTSNVDVGTANLTITGTGMYCGELNYSFKILPKELASSMFSVDTSDEIYDGSAKSKKITTSLIENQDYTVNNTSNVKVGTANITITGKGMYYGELNYSFKILPKELDRSMFTVDTDDEIYDGGAKSKTITSSLTENEDYVVSFTSNVDVGTAYITITGTGMYYGELNYWFRIRDAFDDVTNKDYFYNAVTWAVNHDPQITKGTSDTTFSPSDTCTRGQAVTFLWRASGCEKVTDVENPFTDVKSSDYFYDAVLWAYKNKITTGTTATTFGPNETCNRGQIVTFLWRSQGEPKSDVTIDFTDVADNAYYYAPVRWAVEKGVTKGTTDKTFSPNDSCTRGQIVTFLYRAVS